MSNIGRRICRLGHSFERKGVDLLSIQICSSQYYSLSIAGGRLFKWMQKETKAFIGVMVLLVHILISKMLFFEKQQDPDSMFINRYFEKKYCGCILAGSYDSFCSDAVVQSFSWSLI